MKKALTITDVEDAKKIAEIFESLDINGKLQARAYLSALRDKEMLEAEQKAGEGNVEIISNPVAVLDCDSDTG